jgi:hypothetical protein
VSLLSVGRRLSAAQSLTPVTPGEEQTIEQVADEANTKIEDARKGLLDTLTPWIPGDFVVTYGLLLTAWDTMQESFEWLLAVALLCALTYVVLGAFAQSGFRATPGVTLPSFRGLIYRSIAGALVSVLAAIAIPTSGWYDFEWFRDNELSTVVTATLVAAALVLLLKGLQRRTRIDFGG